VSEEEKNMIVERYQSVSSLADKVNVCAVLADLEALLPELIISDIVDNAGRMGLDLAPDFAREDRQRKGTMQLSFFRQKLKNLLTSGHTAPTHDLRAVCDPYLKKEQCMKGTCGL
jgi:hypothetical protein